MTAYTLVLNGRFLRYRDELEDALVQLSVARGILDVLAESAETSRDQALATYFADEIGPEIRYCAHELGRAKAYDVDGIVREQATLHRAQIVDGYEALVQKLKTEGGAELKGNERKLRTLLWEGEPVPVRNPELVDVLVKVQEGEVKLREESIEVSRPIRTDQERKKRRPAEGGKSKRGVAAYDNILLALSDAEDVARKLAEAQKNASGSTSAPGVRDIHFVHVFIVYHLLARRIQRDLLLVSTILAQNPQASRKVPGGKTASSSKSQKETTVDTRLYPAVVKLFDTILQSLNQMRTLSIVDESPDLAAAVDSRVSFTNARR
jgi:signal recognition particle subunit SRP68